MSTEMRVTGQSPGSLAASPRAVKSENLVSHPDCRTLETPRDARLIGQVCLRLERRQDAVSSWTTARRGSLFGAGLLTPPSLFGAGPCSARVA